MSDYLIDSENLTAIAEAIRNNAPLEWEGRIITPEEMPSAIDDVWQDGRNEGYDIGYEEGQSSGGGSSSEPILYGTYMLTDDVNFSPPPEYITLELGETYAFHFDDNGDYVYQPIPSIDFGDDGLVYINSSIPEIYLEFDGTGWVYQHRHYGRTQPPDDRFRIIDIKVPTSVTQEIYDLFMGIVDCDGGVTPYEVGYGIGYEEGASNGGGGSGGELSYGTAWIRTQMSYFDGLGVPLFPVTFEIGMTWGEFENSLLNIRNHPSLGQIPCVMCDDENGFIISLMLSEDSYFLVSFPGCSTDIIQDGQIYSDE